jgi:hypothetical protein
MTTQEQAQAEHEEAAERRAPTGQVVYKAISKKVRLSWSAVPVKFAAVRATDA